MRRVAVFTDSPATVATLRRHFGRQVSMQFAPVAQLGRAPPDYHNIIETGLNDTSRLLQIKEWLKAAPEQGKVIFITGSASRLETIRACAIGATHVVAQPLKIATLLRIVGDDFKALAHRSAASDEPGSIESAFFGLQGMFSSAVARQPVDTGPLAAASSDVVDEIESRGLKTWVDAVRKHHSGTYQHCLLVTGLAAAFGQHLRFSQADRQRLALAAMLHDVGKARIPVAVLEKPSALDAEETALMRQHPRLGVEALGEAGLPQEILDVVLHHHEYLDGSGYPLGLAAGDIPDLVRMITIADVFAALIEVRAYKPALPYEKAYAILREMGGRLDGDLVREFRAAVGFD